jgi:hypothetical protein
MSAELVEEPPESGRIEMHLRLQGVGAGQPRRIIVPYETLLSDATFDPDTVHGKAFQAEILEMEPGRWVVVAIGFGERRVLRPE